MGTSQQDNRHLKQKERNICTLKNIKGTVPIEDHLQRAAAHADRAEFDEAIDLYKKAAEKIPTNCNIFDNLADVCMEAGRPEDAVIYLRKSIELAPDVGFEKYMYLSQLMGNSVEAIAIARKGVDVLRKKKANTSTDSEAWAEICTYEASAWCGIAETLLAVSETSNNHQIAEELDKEAELAVAEALAVSEDGSASELESSLALANLRLSQGRPEEASVVMTRVVSFVQQGLNILDDPNINDDGILNGIERLPSMEMRIAIGKQLLEVGLWQDAVRVLKSTLHECDFNVEVWYMLSAAYHNMSDSTEALKALDILQETKTCLEGFDGEVDDVHVESLRLEIQQTISTTCQKRDNNFLGDHERRHRSHEDVEMQE